MTVGAKPRDPDAVARALSRCFGLPTLGNKRNPLDELLYVVLSVRTPPSSYQEGYLRLRRDFPRWDYLVDADVSDIAAITRGGLQRKKADQIRGIARKIRQAFGRVTLAPLRRMGDRQAEEFLLSLPGVGVKTARCVLIYSLDREAFPVDTHCLRVVRRLGWIDPAAPLTRALADQIQDLIPRALRKTLHVAMIALGRTICLPRVPACVRCPILVHCPTGSLRLMETGSGHSAFPKAQAPGPASL